MGECNQEEGAKQYRMNNVDNMSLLDYLAAKVGVRYLSDLHMAELRFPLRHVLRALDIESFDLTEWNDAVYYITGEEKYFTEISEAAKYLMQNT